ncbi:hypothetical protein L249_5570, partial [Ophiocordyceps polyrhachis-furcata BCC 54312]
EAEAVRKGSFFVFGACVKTVTTARDEGKKRANREAASATYIIPTNITTYKTTYLLGRLVRPSPTMPARALQLIHLPAHWDRRRGLQWRWEGGFPPRLCRDGGNGATLGQLCHTHNTASFIKSAEKKAPPPPHVPCHEVFPPRPVKIKLL